MYPTNWYYYDGYSRLGDLNQTTGSVVVCDPSTGDVEAVYLGDTPIKDTPTGNACPPYAWLPATEGAWGLWHWPGGGFTPAQAGISRWTEGATVAAGADTFTIFGFDVATFDFGSRKFWSCNNSLSPTPRVWKRYGLDLSVEFTGTLPDPLTPNTWRFGTGVSIHGGTGYMLTGPGSVGWVDPNNPGLPTLTEGKLRIFTVSLADSQYSWIDFDDPRGGRNPSITFDKGRYVVFYGPTLYNPETDTDSDDRKIEIWSTSGEVTDSWHVPKELIDPDKIIASTNPFFPTFTAVTVVGFHDAGIVIDANYGHLGTVSWTTPYLTNGADDFRSMPPTAVEGGVSGQPLTYRVNINGGSDWIVA